MCMKGVTCEPWTPTLSRYAKLFFTMNATAGSPSWSPPWRHKNCNKHCFRIQPLTEADLDRIPFGLPATSLTSVQTDLPIRDSAPMPVASDGTLVSHANNRSTRHIGTGPTAHIYTNYGTGMRVTSCVFSAATAPITCTRVMELGLSCTYGHFEVTPFPKAAPNCGHLFLHSLTNPPASP